MKKNDEGFSTPLAMTIIFSLSVAVISVAMLVSSTERKLNSYKNSVLAQKEADSVIFSLEKDFQALKNSSSDSAENPDIMLLVSRYSDYNLTLKDVSTGINRNFFSEKFCESKGIKDYIASCGESAFVEYGWVNPKYADKKLLESIELDFENGKTFPIENSYPAFNVNFMGDDFLKAVFEFSGIKKAEEKIRKVRESLYGDFDEKEMAKLLGVDISHPVFDFLGCKTVFWKADFETQKCIASAVFAIIPEKENPRSIDCYRLIEKNVSFKGGI